MYEILTQGNVRKEFNRLGMHARRTYGNSTTLYSVYSVSDHGFDALCKDAEDNNPEHWKNCGWRWVIGSNQSAPDTEISVNGHRLLCWDRDDGWGFDEYTDLLSYLSNVMGCSAFRNVCALTTDLAKYNGMALGELFSIYQGEGN